MTGAASGIGRATAIRLAAEGAAVACLDRDLDGLAATIAAIEDCGGRAVPLPCDLVERVAIPAAVESAVAALGGVDAVCNIAGVGGFWMDEGFPIEEWDRLIAVNLTATWLVCQAALPALLANERSAIVNTASTAATDATPYETAYAATKGGVIALTRSLAINHAKAGLRANCVAPGPIDTPIALQYAPPPDADRQLLRMITPFGDVGRPEDVASVFAFLGVRRRHPRQRRDPQGGRRQAGLSTRRRGGVRLCRAPPGRGRTDCRAAASRSRPKRGAARLSPSPGRGRTDCRAAASRSRPKRRGGVRLCRAPPGRGRTDCRAAASRSRPKRRRRRSGLCRAPPGRGKDRLSSGSE